MIRAKHPHRRPRSGGTTRARQSFQCRVADLVSSTAAELNAAGVLQPPVKLDDATDGAS